MAPDHEIGQPSHNGREWCEGHPASGFVRKCVARPSALKMQSGGIGHCKTTRQNIGRRLGDAAALEKYLEDATPIVKYRNIETPSHCMASSKESSSTVASSKRLPVFCREICNAVVAVQRARWTGAQALGNATIMPQMRGTTRPAAI